MYKILIIGGGGFLGFHLANFFLFKKIYKVDIIDNLSKGTNDKYFKTLLKEKNINFYKQDISKNEIKIKKKDYDYIFQFAALLGVDKVIKNPHEVLIKNVLIQKNAIEFAKKQKNLKKFIFSSTSEVHIGNEKKMLLKFPTPEDFNIILDDLSHPRSSYSLSKIYGEALLYQSKIPFSIIRPHNLYGERMGNLHVIPQLFNKIRKLKSNQVLNLMSANHKRCFCYISDSVEQIYNLMVSKKFFNESVNIGNNNEEISIKKLSIIISKILGKNIKINNIKNTNGSPKRRVPNLKKIMKISQNMQFLNIEDGCYRIYKWQKRNKNI